MVRDVAVTYLSPAGLDDELQVTAALSEVGGATVTMRQSVKRGSEVLVAGDIKIACVDKTSKKPRRLPSAIPVVPLSPVRVMMADKRLPIIFPP